VRWGGERGFGEVHGRRSQAALPLVTGSSGRFRTVSAGRHKMADGVLD